MQLSPWEAFGVSFPVVAIVLVSVAIVFHKIGELLRKRKQRWRRHMQVSASSVVLGLAFLPLAVVYRPSLIEAVKVQYRQLDDADEDENGDPDSPLNHLRKQLRRIRRGEKVETLLVRQR